LYKYKTSEQVPNVLVVLVRQNQEYKCQEVVLAIANFITP